jgi:hypothetical protein
MQNISDKLREKSRLHSNWIVRETLDIVADTMDESKTEIEDSPKTNNAFITWWLSIWRMQ